MCEAGGDAACPAEIEAERNREETQLCYKQPCPGTHRQNLTNVTLGCCQSGKMNADKGRTVAATVKYFVSIFSFHQVM